MARTLVIQLGRLGDVIQTTPLLVELRGTGTPVYPEPRRACAPVGTCTGPATGNQVDVLALRSAHEPLLGFSAVANIITIPDSLKPLDDAIACGFPRGEIPAEAYELLAELQLPVYDCIINASHAPLGCWLAGAIPCTDPDARYGGIIRDRECLYLGPANSYRVAMLQFREQNLFNLVDLLRAAHGAAPPIQRPCLYANQSANLPFELPAGRKVALNPGASEAARCWPAENFARLAEALSVAGFTPLLVGAPSDRELCEQICSTARVPISNFAGRTTIPEMATLLARCELLISADTGAAHLAAAVGTTVVGLYGATAWFAETAPYGDNHLILQTPLNALMSAISVDSVLCAVLNRLGRVPVNELRRELRRQNQSAWETSIQSPLQTRGTGTPVHPEARRACAPFSLARASSDPLGGLMYRPLHRDALNPDDLFAQCLRQSFAAEFVTSSTIESAPRTGSAGTLAGSPTPIYTNDRQRREHVSLAQIFDHMHALAIFCGDSMRTRSASSKISNATHELIATMEKLRASAAEPAWRRFSPIIHSLDWQLRMLPEQSAEQTFRAHADAYVSAARILQRTHGTAKDMHEKQLAVSSAASPNTQDGHVAVSPHTSPNTRDGHVGVSSDASPDTRDGRAQLQLCRTACERGGFSP
jgi:glycosyl transferase family 9 (putative heptosyltransferase)